MNDSKQNDEITRDIGWEKLQRAKDLVEAERRLTDAGGTESEIDLILGCRPIPFAPTDDWAREQLAWYTREVDGGNHGID